MEVLANPRGSGETAKMAAEAPLDRLLRLILIKEILLSFSNFMLKNY